MGLVAGGTLPRDLDQTNCLRLKLHTNSEDRCLAGHRCLAEHRCLSLFVMSVERLVLSNFFSKFIMKKLRCRARIRKENYVLFYDDYLRRLVVVRHYSLDSHLCQVD